MKLKLLSFALPVFIFASELKAQVSNYTFTQTVGSYGPANTGTLVGAILQDDDVNTVSLPFNFVYNGTSYNSINVCSNGYLSFNFISGTEYQPISDNTTQNLIAPFGQDLFMGTIIMGDLTSGSNTITNCSSVAGYSVGDALFDYGSDFGNVNPIITSISGSNVVVNINATGSNPGYTAVNLHGGIKNNVSGTAPNRICEFEYRNFARYGVYDENIRFKLRLYETSNKIEFVYGTMITGTDFTPSEVGLKGNSNADFNSRMVTSPTLWSSSIASSFITDVCDFQTGSVPQVGLSYMWGPVSCTAPSITIAASSSTVCPGSSATLAASGASTYSWSTGTNGSVTVVSPATNTVYMVTGSNGTCTATSTIGINVINSAPLVVSSSSSVLCSGTSATLSASGANTYSWSTGTSGSVTVVTPATNTVYMVSGNNGTCNVTATIGLSVTSTPTLVVSTSTGVICIGYSATLNASGASTYTWSTNASGSSIVVSPTINTVYNVTGSTGNCSSSGSVSVNVMVCPTGLVSNGFESTDIMIYPNPFANMLTIKNPGKQSFTLVIRDAIGKIVLSSEVADNTESSVDTGTLAKGFYFIELGNADIKLTKKLIKE